MQWPSGSRQFQKQWIIYINLELLSQSITKVYSDDTHHYKPRSDWVYLPKVKHSSHWLKYHATEDFCVERSLV